MQQLQYHILQPVRTSEHGEKNLTASHYTVYVGLPESLSGGGVDWYSAVLLGWF